MQSAKRKAGMVNINAKCGMRSVELSFARYEDRAIIIIPVLAQIKSGWVTNAYDGGGLPRKDYTLFIKRKIELK